ncbi:MAG: kelch-like protein [bacterium]|nr:kelch-like protein [bacterium]
MRYRATLLLLLLIKLGFPPAWALRDPAWTPSGSFGNARTGHTATLLPSGKVLVAGGRDDRSSLASAELYDPATGTWTETGALATARDGHAAILLPSGKVLVAGGKNRSALASAELYDPATGSWRAAGVLANAREGHTATLLPSGQVLVAGGAKGLPGSAELYDPATGSWTGAGALGSAADEHTATRLPSGKVLLVGAAGAESYDPVTGSRTATGGPVDGGRTAHSATLLRSGKVLVAGGAGGGGLLSSAGLYDPATGAWTTTGPLADRRASHTATLLPSGKVLVVGGRADGDSILSSAELYDPATGTWTRIGPLAYGRTGHTATLLSSGSLLIAGGESQGKILSALLSGAELYDPATGSWTATGPRVEARSFHTATLLPSGNVLVAGGTAEETLRSALLSSAELYAPATGTWTTTGSPNHARSLHTATLLASGKVLFVGGIEGIEWTGSISTVSTDPLSSAELYAPATGTWTAGGPLAEARSYHSATLLPSGKVLVAGGWDERVRSLESAELFDPATGTWTAAGSLGNARAGHSATLLPSGKVLVAGGIVKGEKHLSTAESAELYDPATGTWLATGSLGNARAGHSATLLPSGKVLVAGGIVKGEKRLSTVDSAELYDPATGSWLATGSLGHARASHSATFLPFGKVLVAGGLDRSSAELYDPATGTWTPTGSLKTVREGHTATLLPSGKVLEIGGASRRERA